MVPEDWERVDPDRPMDLCYARMDLHCFRGSTGTVAHVPSVQSCSLTCFFVFGFLFSFIIARTYTFLEVQRVHRIPHPLNTCSSTNSGFQQPTMVKPSSRRSKQASKSKQKAKSPDISSRADEVPDVVIAEPPAAPSNGPGAAAVSCEVPPFVRAVTIFPGRVWRTPAHRRRYRYPGCDASGRCACLRGPRRGRRCPNREHHQ